MIEYEKDTEGEESAHERKKKKKTRVLGDWIL